jgi:hypothetical protein
MRAPNACRRSSASRWRGSSERFGRNSIAPKPVYLTTYGKERAMSLLYIILVVVLVLVLLGFVGGRGRW